MEKHNTMILIVLSLKNSLCPKVINQFTHTLRCMSKLNYEKVIIEKKTEFSFKVYN